MPDTSNEQKDDKKPDGQPPASTPQFVPVEEFKKLEATLAQQQASFDDKISRLTEAVLSGRQQQPTVAQPTPARKRTTREEVETAMNEGKGADAVMRIVNEVEQTIDERVTAAVSKLTTDVIKPMQDTGFEAIGNVTKEVVKTRMPNYTRFKDDIDKQIASLPPQARLNPETLVAVHDYIVGKNIDKIVQEKVEAALRQGADADGGSLPGVTGARSADTGKSKVPQPADLWGPEAVEALRMKGMTPEQHVQKLGHKSWEDYTKFYAKQMEESRA